MQLYSPEGTPLPLSMSPPPRPAQLNGLRIGLFDNTKAPVDEIMRYLEARLGKRIPGATFFQIAKKHPSLPAEQEVIAALAENTDVVITALGD